MFRWLTCGAFVASSIFLERCGDDVCEHIIPNGNRPGRPTGLPPDLLKFKTVQRTNGLANVVFDEIVVGGGAAGCAYAGHRARLDPKRRILLVERGGLRKDHLLTQNMYGAGLVIADETVSQPLVTSDGVRSHIASVLGGGSSTGMAIMIAEDSDYLDEIERMAANPEPIANVSDVVAPPNGKWKIDRKAWFNAGKEINDLLATPVAVTQPYTQALTDSLIESSGFHRAYGSSPNLKADGLWNAWSLFNATNDNFRQAADLLVASTDHPQPPNLLLLTRYNVDRIVFQYPVTRAASHKSEEAAAEVWNDWIAEETATRRPEQANTTASEPTFAPTEPHPQGLRARCVELRPTDSHDIEAAGLGQPWRIPQKRVDVGATIRVCARDGITLAAGALLSPSLLAVSGVGSRRQMEELNVTRPVLVNDHMGEHLIDRGLVPLSLWRSDPQRIGFGNELEPQVCGVVGLQRMGVDESLPEVESTESTDATESTTNLPAPTDAPFLGTSLPSSGGEKGTSYYDTSYMQVEEISGGRILEGFLYATRIVFPPPVRNSAVADSVMALMNYCSEKERASVACDAIAFAPRCLRKLSGSWFFLPNPKSRGHTLTRADGSLEVTPKYFSHPDDLRLTLNAVRNLLNVTNASDPRHIFDRFGRPEGCPKFAASFLRNVVLSIITITRRIAPIGNPVVAPESGGQCEKVAGSPQDSLDVWGDDVFWNGDSSLGGFSAPVDVAALVAKLEPHQFDALVADVTDELLSAPARVSQMGQKQESVSALVTPAREAVERLARFVLQSGSSSAVHRAPSLWFASSGQSSVASDETPSEGWGRQKLATFPFQMPRLDKDDEVVNYMHFMKQSMWHWVGSLGAGSVVDSDFNIIGIDGLSVVDASVLPQQSRMNPTHTVLTLARYAALRKHEALKSKKGANKDMQGQKTSMSKLWKSISAPQITASPVPAGGLRRVWNAAVASFSSSSTPQRPLPVPQPRPSGWSLGGTPSNWNPHPTHTKYR